MQNETEDFALSQGLQGQDDNIEMLLKLWDELQSSSVDVAQAPVPNLFAFAESAFFFAVIMQKKKPDAKADKGNAKQMNMSFDAPAHSGPVNLFEKNYRDESRFGPSSTGEVMVPIDTEHAPEVFSTDEWDTIVADAELAGAYRDLHHYPSSHPNVYEIPDMGISSAVSPFNKFLSPPTQSPIGLLYLTSTPHTYAPAGEMNIGIVLDAASRGRGYARQAIELVLTWVFEDVKFHRVQAAILDPSSRPRALTLFTQMGFGHEGTRRRSVFSPNEGMWKDATYLGMLDTEWLMRSYFKPAPKSLWDEMFLRHTREREELLDWDETRSKLQRTSSMETLRNAAPSPDLELSSSASQIQLEPEVDASDAASDIVPLTKDKGKRKRDEIPEPWDDRVASPPPPSSYDTSASDDSDFESAPSRFRRVQAVNDVPSARRFTIGASPGSSESDTRSVSPESSVDSVDSRWDLLETSSGGSSSDFEHLQKVK